MKKTRTVLHLILIISIISCIVNAMNVERNGFKYMTKEQAEKEYSLHFHSEVATILEHVGFLAEFNDKYGSDESELKKAKGYTVGELKAMYNEDENIIYEYEDLLSSCFYYTKGVDEAGEYFYDEIYDNYIYDFDYIKKYGFDTFEAYEQAKDKYEAMFTFFSDYRYALEIKSDLHFETVSNMVFAIQYTDKNGELVTYGNVDYDAIIKNNIRYKEYFLYDQLNNTSIIKNFDKESAGYDTLVYKCKTFSDYTDFKVVFAVDNNYPYNDRYSYYAKDVVTDAAILTKYNIIVAATLISGIVLFVSLVGLMILTGKDESKKIKLYQIDRLWWDIIAAGMGAMGVVIYVVLESSEILKCYTQNDVVIFGIFLFIAMEACVVFLLSIVRRLKSKRFWKTSAVGHIIRFLIRITKKMWEDISALKKAVALATTVLLLMIAQSVLAMQIYNGDEYCILIWLVVGVAFIIFVFWFTWKFNSEYNLIINETQKIAEGDVINKIDAPIKFNVNKKMAKAVNSIGDGINTAVAESVKNERMKSDLITNVSHDIKTPLTSIINYVNLLKMEEIKDEKVSNYIRVLDEKSQRLKILTDDLVEASKLSSGVIKLELGKLNIVELLRQSEGEYEEKFNEKCLEVMMNLPMAPIYVKADGRKMWRVLENLYGNIYKYALKGTRVYVDLFNVNGKVVLTVKNISNSPLNFESDDPTERFIRGDVSRSTEGSGLGLSIAKSIIDRHGGEFKIILDGDLFKIIIKLDEFSDYFEEGNLDENK